MPLKLNNKIIDDRLMDKNIQRLDDYIGSNSKIRFRHTISACNHIWLCAPGKILNKNTGCPKCNGIVKLTNDIVDVKLQFKNIKRIGNYINSSTKIEFQCLNDQCGYVWNTAPSNIFRYGCPNCAGLAKLSNSIIDEKILPRNIKRLGEYTNNQSKILWKCLNCSSEWLAIICNILNKKQGCPFCKNKNEKLIFKLLEKKNVEFECQKSLKSINKSCKNNYRVDFYLLKYNLIIEYNGAQHYKPVRFGGMTQEKAIIAFESQKIRDEYVRCFCAQNTISLLEIDGRVIKNDLLIEFINNIVDKLTEKEK